MLPEFWSPQVPTSAWSRYTNQIPWTEFKTRVFTDDVCLCVTRFQYFLLHVTAVLNQCQHFTPVFCHCSIKLNTLYVCTKWGMWEHHTGKSFPFPHVFNANITRKTWIASFSRSAWGRQDKNLKSISELKKQPVNRNVSLAFEYLHEELWALGHEQSEEESRGEAGDRAEHHKHSPALKGQWAHRKMHRGLWNDQPGQTCTQTHRQSLKTKQLRQNVFVLDSCFSSYFVSICQGRSRLKSKSLQLWHFCHSVILNYIYYGL